MNSSVLALLDHLELALLDDVEADDAEVADVFLHEARDVVVAHEQHVDRHVLAVADQLVLAAGVAEPAAHEQLEGVVREPAGLLDGDLDPGFRGNSHGHFSCAVRVRAG